MLSYQEMGVPQPGQRDRGRTTDSPAGTRAMTTFRKLPTTAPTTTAQPAAKGRSSGGRSRAGT